MAFTSEQDDTLWELWSKGEPSRFIARDLRSNASAASRHLAKHGGVRPLPRRRSRLQLTSEQREGVTRGIAAGLSNRAIAASIGRAPSTVSREIARNGGRDAYRATAADAAARGDRSRRVLRPIPNCCGSCGTGWRRIGRRNRSRTGCDESTRRIETFRFRTRRSIARSTSPAVASSAASTPSTCARAGQCGMQECRSARTGAACCAT